MKTSIILALFVMQDGTRLLAAESVTFSPAPPAVADSGLVPALPEPPPGAIVFDLKYRPQTGAKDNAFRKFIGEVGNFFLVQI